MSNKQFVFVIIVTFIVIIIWIIADVLHTKPSVEVNPKLQTLLAPIDPNFDQKVISEIQEVTPLSNLTSTITTAPIAAKSGQTTPPASSSALIIPTTNFQIPPSPPATSSAQEGTQ